MMNLAKPYDTFLEELGHRLKAFGFPEHVRKKTMFFQQKTPIGFVGIHVNPLKRYDGIDFSLRCSISVTSVQERLVRTELYQSDGGLTWTCGALLKELRRLQGWNSGVRGGSFLGMRDGIDVDAIAEKVAQFGTDDGYVSFDDEASRVAAVAQRTFDWIAQYGWPLLREYGFSEDSFLDFTLRTDTIAELFFLDPEKPLSGLILADKLNRHEAKMDLIERANQRYRQFAKVGNTEPLETFVRIGTQLGLLSV